MLIACGPPPSGGNTSPCGYSRRSPKKRRSSRGYPADATPDRGNRAQLAAPLPSPSRSRERSSVHERDLRPGSGGSACPGFLGPFRIAGAIRVLACSCVGDRLELYIIILLEIAPATYSP